MPIIVTPGLPVTAPITDTSPSGRLTATVDPVFGGVLLQANYSALSGIDVRKVRFMRADGTIVRSGHDAWSPGGIATAYDFEMPLGQASAWKINGQYRLSNGTHAWTNLTPTLASDTVTLNVPDLTPEADFWLKSVSNPNLSMRLAQHGEDPEFSLVGRDSLVELPGSSLPGGSWGVPLAQPVTYTFWVKTRAERDALKAVVSAGPLLIQAMQTYGIDDGFYVFAGMGEKYLVGGYDPRRMVTLTFKPISRPPTEGSPLYIPSRSYADINANFVSYAALEAAKPTYGDMLDS